MTSGQGVSTLLWRIWLGALVVFMLMPLLLVVLFAFAHNELTNFPMGGFSLRWFDELFRNRKFWSSLQDSLIVAGSVGLISTVVGTMAALALARVRPRVAGATIIALSFPIMLPPLVIGIACLSFFVSLGLKLSLFTVILGHLIITQPFVILVVYARMLGFDYAAVESARDLGASPAKAFVTVTLPIIQPSVIGAGLIAMALSLDDFVITFFTIGGGGTLPMLVWGMLRTTLNPTVNAMGTILISLTLVSTVIALRLTRYRG